MPRGACTLASLLQLGSLHGWLVGWVWPWLVGWVALFDPGLFVGFACSREALLAAGKKGQVLCESGQSSLGSRVREGFHSALFLGGQLCCCCVVEAPPSVGQLVAAWRQLQRHRGAWQCISRCQCMLLPFFSHALWFFPLSRGWCRRPEGWCAHAAFWDRWLHQCCWCCTNSGSALFCLQRLVVGVALVGRSCFRKT